MLSSVLKKPLLFLAMGGLLSIPVGASAQGAGDYERPTPPEASEQTPKQPMTQNNYDGKTLDGFVAAYDEVQNVHQQYVQKLENTEDPSKATELQREAQEKIAETVQDHGLTMDQYHQIVADYRNNPELRERINERM